MRSGASAFGGKARFKPLKSRRLPGLPVSLAHPLNPGSRGVFVAVADVAVHDLDQLIADSGGQPVIVSQVEHSAITRPKRDLDPTQTLTEHAQKIGSA
jgi:hypothetical protein